MSSLIPAAEQNLKARLLIQKARRLACSTRRRALRFFVHRPGQGPAAGSSRYGQIYPLHAYSNPRNEG